MPTLIPAPTIIQAAGNKPKRIEEYAGRVNSGHAEVSVARMVSPEGWQEPGQRPDFEEITLVLRGILRVEHDQRHDGGRGRAGRRHAAGRMGPLRAARPPAARSTWRSAFRPSRRRPRIATSRPTCPRHLRRPPAPVPAPSSPSSFSRPPSWRCFPGWSPGRRRVQSMRSDLTEVLAECRVRYAGAVTARDTAAADAWQPTLHGSHRPGDPTCGPYRRRNMIAPGRP